jgi:hypothetical protein
MKMKTNDFIEKWSVVSNEEFFDSFPTNCVIGCTILKENAESYIVSTLKPWDIESEEKLTRFEISKSLLMKI